MCVAAEKRRADLAPADQRSDLLVLLCVRCGFSGRVSFGRAGFGASSVRWTFSGFLATGAFGFSSTAGLRVRLRSFVGRRRWRRGGGVSAGVGVGATWTTESRRFGNAKKANTPHTSNSNAAPEATHGMTRLRSGAGFTIVVSLTGTVARPATVLVGMAATVLAAACGKSTVCASPRSTTVAALFASEGPCACRRRWHIADRDSGPSLLKETCRYRARQTGSQHSRARADPVDR